MQEEDHQDPEFVIPLSLWGLPLAHVEAMTGGKITGYQEYMNSKGDFDETVAPNVSYWVPRFWNGFEAGRSIIDYPGDPCENFEDKGEYLYLTTHIYPKWETPRFLADHYFVRVENLIFKDRVLYGCFDGFFQGTEIRKANDDELRLCMANYAELLPSHIQAPDPK